MDSVAPPQTFYKTFKYKLRPTKTQIATFERWLDVCREMYNAGLEERREAWRMRRISVGRFQQMAQLKDIRAEIPECAEVSSHVLQNVLTRLDRAFQSYFRRLKADEHPHYPRFHGRNRYCSFTFPSVGNETGNHCASGYLVLSRIGRVAMRQSRPLEGIPKTITVCREADGWYACISCADVPRKSLPSTGQETGIDLGIESFARLADGSEIPNPRIFRVWELHLKRAQRRALRRVKGSRRRRKAVKLLAKAHQKVRRARQDFHHKKALDLVREYDTIYHEDLQTAPMVRRPKPQPDGKGGYHKNGSSAKSGLNKSIGDAGWGRFRIILTSKAAYAGKTVVAVPPAFTSQTCSGCGALVQKGLSVRWHSCPECGTELHRDHNAALNILKRGKELSGAGQAPQALT